MKKAVFIFLLLFFGVFSQAQELLANVQINYNQIGGSNTQVFTTLEKNLRDFINNTSWTGKRVQSFERIKCNFSLVISERPTQNTFKGSLVVQAVRPVFNSQYETPLLNINDTNFSFEYTENENLIFNERQFSGKNLTDVISFYVYVILGYDADSFKVNGGKEWFEKAQKISQNSQNQSYTGWSQMEGLKTRGALINELLREQNATLRTVYYAYHRAGLDNLSQPNQNSAKQIIANELLKLRAFENNFQMNYPINVFLEAKKDEIFNIFDSNNNTSVNMSELKSLMTLLLPKETDSKWNKWK
ncbi:MAG: DUF4835 family protein [Cloacibacterium sp.]|nr:DUF4835 family protein [Cloacibacterium sp.]